MHPHVQELNIKGCVELTDVGLWSIGRYCTKLERLDLSYVNQFTHVGLRSMCLQCRVLKDLDFSFCPQFNDLCLRSVAAHCKNLERLTLRDAKHITDRGLAEVAQGCTRLQYLDLHGCCRLSEYGDAALKRFAKFCRNLYYLDLLGCEHIGEGGVEALATCTKMETLLFDSCLAGISKPKAAFELATLTKLTRLSLTGWTTVNNKTIKALAKKLTSLTVLDLSGIPALTQDGLQHLRHCTQLVDLDLSRCTKIAEKSLQCLAKVRPHLETLSLLGCGRVRPHALTTLTQQCTRLTTLRLTENKHVSRRFVEDLSAECPFSDFSRDHFGLSPVPDHEDCIHAEEVRRVHTTASIRIQAFVRGTEARGGVAVLRRTYLRLKAIVRMQKAWRGASMYAQTRKLLELIRRQKVSTSIQRVWRGHQGRKIARRRRLHLHYMANVNAAATKIESVYRGHVVRAAAAETRRLKADALRRSDVLQYRDHRCAARVQKAFRDHKRRMIYWASQAMKKERERMEALRNLMATVIQCRWRIFLARRVYAQRLAEAQQRRFVRVVAKLQARLRGYRARMLRKQLEADRDWYEYQSSCAEIIQRSWRIARSRFTVKVLRSLARLRIAEVKAVKIMQRFARGCAGRHEVRMMMMLKELKLKQWKAAKKIQRLLRGNKGRELAEVTLALLEARRAAAHIYTEVERVEKERRAVNQKFVILDKKIKNLIKQRNHVAKELREVFQAKGKYYDSESLNPGVRQRYVVDFLKTELQRRLRTLKSNIAPIKNVIGLLKDKIADYDRELRLHKRKLKPYEEDVVENTLANRKKRMRKVLTEKYDSAVLIQAIFRGYRVREAMKRSPGINYWVEMWDEEEETQCYFNTQTQERKFFKPAEITLFGVEPQQVTDGDWVENWDGNADSFVYYNTDTGDYRWEKPHEFQSDADDTSADPEADTLNAAAAEIGAEWFKKQDKAALSARSQHTGRTIYDWEELQDEDTGQTYYLNPKTGEVKWSLPPDATAAASTEAPSKMSELAVSGENIPVAPPGEFIPIVGTPEPEPVEEDKVKDEQADALAADEQEAAVGDAPLDNDWEECEDETTGAVFYFNTRTGLSQWERPALKQVKALMYMGAFKTGGEDGTEDPLAIQDEPADLVEPEAIEATPTPVLDEEWEEVDDGEGNKYFYNSRTGVSQWERPFLLLSAMAAFKTAEKSGGENTDTLAVVTKSEDDPEWEEIADEEGNKYYYNSVTGESSWEKPLSLLRAAMAFQTGTPHAQTAAPMVDEANTPADLEWEQVNDEEGNQYYYNSSTGESRWDVPRGMRARLAAVAMFQHATSSETDEVYPGAYEDEAAAATYDEATGAYHDHGYDDGSAYHADAYDESAAYTNEHGNHESYDDASYGGSAHDATNAYDESYHDPNAAYNETSSGGAGTSAWEPVEDDEGNVYYYNATTGESSWELPT